MMHMLHMVTTHCCLGATEPDEQCIEGLDLLTASGLHVTHCHPRCPLGVAEA